MPGPAQDLQAIAPALLDTRAGRIEVASAGAGSAVMVVHGTPGDWRQGLPLAEDLAADHRVLLVSRPGYGATPISTGRNYDEHADAYAAVLDELGIERCAVVGVSGGGPSAAAFAHRHADRTSHLVLACAMAAHLVSVPRDLRWSVAPGLAEVLTPLARTIGRRRLRDPAKVDKAMERALTVDELERTRSDPRIVEDLLRHARSMVDGPSALAGLRNDLAQVQAAHRSTPPTYNGVDCPVLLLYADDDDVIGLDHARYYEGALPGARLEIFEGAGHVFALTRRSEVTARIGTFIAGHA